MKKTAIVPTRESNYAEWYQQVIRAADLAENSPVRGCMVIKPWGYGLWEMLQGKLDRRFKETGHENAYFPLFIPLSYLEKEAKHVEGFAKECAVITHSKLRTNVEGHLEPASPLEEPLIVRPTSETIIGEAFSRWVQSYRDLPLLINQWANVVRWEMRTRLFLRTAEFLWQEGHTAHATAEEAQEETLKMLEVYRSVVEEELAIPAIVGEKTASERFPGAEITYTLEAMMQDRKALQLGTSHFLGQNFSRAMNIEFISSTGNKEFAWTTSWGVSTRLIGALIMTHSDDDGLVLPPRIANLHAVILPVVHDESRRESIETYCEMLKNQLSSLALGHDKVKIRVDKRDLRGGEKRWHWIKKGVPVVIEIGLNELENQSVTFALRDRVSERSQLEKQVFIEHFIAQLKGLQGRLFEQAKQLRHQNTLRVDNAKSFYEFFQGPGGFALGFWSEDPEVEAQLKERLKVTVRCLPCTEQKTGPCLFTGKSGCRLAVFAKAY